MRAEAFTVPVALVWMLAVDWDETWVVPVSSVSETLSTRPNPIDAANLLVELFRAWT